MQKAWYIVEVYCILTINHILQNVRQTIKDPVLLGIMISHLAFVFTTALLTFRGSRIASRLLAAFIVIGVLYYLWAQRLYATGFNIYTAYMPMRPWMKPVWKPSRAFSAILPSRSSHDSRRRRT